MGIVDVCDQSQLAHHPELVDAHASQIARLGLTDHRIPRDVTHCFVQVPSLIGVQSLGSLLEAIALDDPHGYWSNRYSVSWPSSIS